MLGKTKGINMTKKKMDTVTYELKRGNEVVYVGTTNDPERREQEHQESGKNFGHMNITSRKIISSFCKISSFLPVLNQ